MDTVYEEIRKGWYAWPALIPELKCLVTIAIFARVTFNYLNSNGLYVFRGGFEGPIFISLFQKYQFSLFFFLLKPLYIIYRHFFLLISTI